MTFVLTTAIFKNGRPERWKIQKIVDLKSVFHEAYKNIPELFLKMKQLLTYGKKPGGHFKNGS